MSEPAATPEDVKAGHPPAKYKRHRGLWICGGIVFFLLAAVVYVNLSPSKPLRTTYITSPLTSDGTRVDYFAAVCQGIRPDNMASDDNGYRLVVQHLGQPLECESSHFACICQELGLDSKAIRPDLTYRNPYAFLDDCFDNPQHNKAILDTLPPGQRSRDSAVCMLEETFAGPWTLDEVPVLARWLEESSPALDLIAKAVRKPFYRIPLIGEGKNEVLCNLVSSRLCHHSHMRSVVRGLMARANYRIGTGDIDGAIDDVITCKRLGRLLGQGPTIDDFLSSMPAESIADDIGIAGSLLHPPTKEQLKRFIDELNDLPFASTPQDKLFFERLCVLDFMQIASYENWRWSAMDGVPDSLPTQCLAVLRVDWNIITKRFNEIVDETMAAGHAPPEPSMTLPVALSMVSIRARSKFVAASLAHSFFSHWYVFPEIAQRNLCFDRMKRITLAMLLYECDHGTLPPAWSVDAEGKPLHSWRVLLLPYLGKEALYAKIRLNEPWDSEYNRQFHGEDLAIYRCPSEPVAGSGQTSYSVVVGPDMPFEGGQGKKLGDFGPDSNDMILLVERSAPVGWMEPAREVTQSVADRGIAQHAASHAGSSIGCHDNGRVLLGLRSGTVLSLQQPVNLGLLRNLLRGTNAEKDYL